MAEKTTSELLIEARATLHQLLTGTSTASITYRERTVVYRSTDLSELYKYIAMLEGQIAVENGGCRPRRTYGVLW